MAAFNQPGRIGLFNAGRLHADAVLLGETAEPADQRTKGALASRTDRLPGPPGSLPASAPANRTRAPNGR